MRKILKTPEEIINNYQKAIHHLKLANDYKTAGEASLWLAYFYSERGDFEHSFDPNLNAVKFLKSEVRKKTGSSYLNYLYQESLSHLSFLYGAAGDYETALNYYRESREFGLTNETGWLFEPEIGESFLNLGQYDSSFTYLKKFKDKASGNLWEKFFLLDTM